MGLAEPKRKVKYSIDPNALHWANNEDKFGKRLMEKMGWEKGKGLGAKEDGMTENIKVRVKSDTKGVGYNNNEYENVWLDHQDEFESLLSNLSQNNNGTEKPSEKADEVQSLERTSKESRRLHYKKFTRSKDLSSVTADDLNCILGTQKRTQIKNSEESNNKSSNSENEDVDTFRASFKLEAVQTQASESSQDSSETKNEEYFGLKFNTNKMSVSDYFANKMASKMNLLKPKSEKIELEETPLVEEECHKVRKNKHLNEEAAEVEEKSEKKKKKHKRQDEEPVEIAVKLESYENVESEEKIEKKKKKKKELVESEGYTVSVKTEEVYLPIDDVANDEETVETRKKKKKKSKEADNEEIVKVEEQVEEVEEVDGAERPKKKKKKSKDKDEDVRIC